MKSFKSLLVMVLLLSFNIYAQRASSAASELLIPVSARGIALNGAYLSGLSGCDAIYYNPAGLARTQDKIEAMFSYMTYLADIDFSYAAFLVNFNEYGTAAFSARNLDFGDMKVTTVDEPYGTGETFSPAFFTFGISYANSLGSSFAFGLSINIVTEKIMRTSASGFSFDFGFQYSDLFSLSGLNLGAAAKNIGSPVTFDGADLLDVTSGGNNADNIQYVKHTPDSDELPLIMEYGISYQASMGGNIKALLACALSSGSYQYNEYRLSGELNYRDYLFLRGGYSLPAETLPDKNEYLWGPSFGAGINYSGDFKITVDYAYRWARLFSANHIITIKLNL